jgi:DNA repair protein RecO (recombination protein O)
MRTTDCEAVVLGAMDYGEADRIVTLFTHDHGKIRAIARHGKKSVQRFGGALEPFARLRIQVVIKEGLSSLRNADVITVFSGIRRDLSKIAHAGYACELTDRLLPEALQNPRLYRLLVSYLDHLDAFPVCADDRRFFEMNLLNILGYRPALDVCSRCGSRPAPAGGLLYLTSTGELACGSCVRAGREVSPATLHLLARTLETGRFGSVRFGRESLDEAGALLDAAIAVHLNRPLTSLSFLGEVNRLG